VYDSLKGKRVIITAAAGGIGRTMAEAFLANGARVHICDIDAEQLAAFEAEQPYLSTSVTDVSDSDQVAGLFEAALAGLGGLDIMINNAGIAGPTCPIEDCSIEDWRRTLAIDLDGTFFCLRHAVPALKQTGGGSIINISSTAGLFGFPYRVPYAAAKWAVIGVAKTLAKELGPFGIRVNAICPGAVAGPRIDHVIEAQAVTRGVDPQTVRDEYLRMSSLRTFIDASDIADMALFLCSDAGHKVSGQALPVDGHIETLAH